MVTWEEHPTWDGGLRLDGLYGLDVVLAPLSGLWSARVTVVEIDQSYVAVRARREDAHDWAITRALRLYPAVVELARRRELEGDPDDMAECRRSEHDLLVLALTRST